MGTLGGIRERGKKKETVDGGMNVIRVHYMHF
jgi:hypothetical protein